jgi:hypothetical protein
LKYYLTHGSAPQHLEMKKIRSLMIKHAQYQLVNGLLFRNNYDGVLLRCLEKYDVEKVLQEIHDGHVRGNFVGDTTAQNILRVGYYWSTMF